MPGRLARPGGGPEIVIHAGAPGETMSIVRIRAASAADAASIAALNVVVQSLHSNARPTWFKPPDPEAFERTLHDWLARDDVLGFIAEDDEAPIGYVLVVRRSRADTALTKGADIVELDQIAVLPACRHRGVGRALAAEVFNLARQVGAARVELGVWEFNQEAHEFFASLGFTSFMRRMVLDLDAAADDRPRPE